MERLIAGAPDTANCVDSMPRFGCETHPRKSGVKDYILDTIHHGSVLEPGPSIIRSGVPFPGWSGPFVLARHGQQASHSFQALIDAKDDEMEDNPR